MSDVAYTECGRDECKPCSFVPTYKKKHKEEGRHKKGHRGEKDRHEKGHRGEKDEHKKGHRGEKGEHGDRHHHDHKDEDD